MTVVIVIVHVLIGLQLGEYNQLQIHTNSSLPNLRAYKPNARIGQYNL